MTPSVELDHLARLVSQIAGLPGPARPRPERALDWRRWASLVEEHQLGPFLGARAGERPGLPPDVERWLVRDAVVSGHGAFARTAELQRLLGRLFGIGSIVLKGGALSFVLYRGPAERAVSDLDLLIAPEDLEAAVARLAADGYRRAASDGLREHHHAPPLTHASREQVVELHTDLATPALPAALISEMWGRRRAIQPGFFVLDPVDRLIHHAIHAVADPVDSPLFRNLFEVAWLLTRLSRAEVRELEARAARFELAPRVGPALELASRLFGTPAILGRQAPAALVFWCERRLGWQGHREGEAWEGRLERAVAIRHLEGIGRAEGLPLAAAVSESLARSARSWLAGARPGSTPRRRGALRAVKVGPGRLVHDGESGAVHLLDPVAAEVWEAADGARDSRDLSARLGPRGLDEAAISSTLALLAQRGLLEWV